MRESDFLNSLSRVKNSYKWTVSNGQIVGKALRGEEFNPITALVRTTRPSVGRTTTELAANMLKLPNHLVEALRSYENRGHGQVLKGRIRKVLGVN